MLSKNKKTTKRGQMKTYRVEIQSLFIKDVEASNKEEAKEIIKNSVNPACSLDFANNNGTFFYEEVDFKNAKIREEG